MIATPAQLASNARYLAIKEKGNALWRAVDVSDPSFALALRKLANGEELSGGSVRLDMDGCPNRRNLFVD